MNKTLLTWIFAICALMANVKVKAQDVTIDFTKLTATPTQDENAKVKGFELTDQDVTFTGEKAGGMNAPIQVQKTNDLRLYAKNTLTVASDKPFSKIIFKVSVKGLYQWAAELPCDNGTITNEPDAQTVTWISQAPVKKLVITVGDKSASFAKKPNKSGQFCVDNAVITFSNSNGSEVKAPAFDKNDVFQLQPINVTITAQASKIFYTTDGSNPTKDSTPYTAPVSIDKNTTLKAIAIDNSGNVSPFTTAEYIFPVVCNGLCDAKHVAPDTWIYLNVDHVVVSYVGAKELYLQEGMHGIGFYTKSNSGTIGNITVQEGDNLTGHILCKFSEFKGLPQLSNDVEAYKDEIIKNTSLNKDQRDKVAIENLRSIDPVKNQDALCRMILLENVKMTQTQNGKKQVYTAIDQNNGEIDVFNKFKIQMPDVQDGVQYTIKGIVAIYGTLYQIFPIEISATTDITNIKVEDKKPQQCYDLSGRRVKPDHKGIIIVNGKKIINN